MSGDLFSSRQAAIDDAIKCMRARWGAGITFPDGNGGLLVGHTTGLSTAMSSFRVASPVGQVLAQFYVFDTNKGFSWDEPPAPPNRG